MSLLWIFSCWQKVSLYADDLCLYIRPQQTNTIWTDHLFYICKWKNASEWWLLFFFLDLSRLLHLIYKPWLSTKRTAFQLSLFSSPSSGFYCFFSSSSSFLSLSRSLPPLFFSYLITPAWQHHLLLCSHSHSRSRTLLGLQMAMMAANQLETVFKEHLSLCWWGTGKTRRASALVKHQTYNTCSSHVSSRGCDSWDLCF